MGPLLLLDSRWRDSGQLQLSADGAFQCSAARVPERELNLPDDCGLDDKAVGLLKQVLSFASGAAEGVPEGKLVPLEECAFEQL
jgi:hypothetical protein